MKKIVRLTESDLIRIVKRVVNEQSNPSKTPPPLLEFVRLMELNQFYLTKFGQKDFKEKPSFATTVANNIVVNNKTISGLQLYRGIPKIRQFKDMYVYIWLDSRNFTTRPSVWVTIPGDSKLFDLSTQFNEFKSYFDKNIAKQY